MKNKKKKLIDFFGILSEKEGEEMQKDLIRIKSSNIRNIYKEH